MLGQHASHPHQYYGKRQQPVMPRLGYPRANYHCLLPDQWPLALLPHVAHLTCLHSHKCCVMLLTVYLRCGSRFLALGTLSQLPPLLACLLLRHLPGSLCE